MTDLELERRHIYETRLGALGIIGPPPKWAHDLAYAESREHLHRMELSEREQMALQLRELRESL